MKKSQKIFTAAFLTSLAAHAVLLGGGGEGQARNSSVYVRSPLRIDMIRVEPEKARKKNLEGRLVEREKGTSPSASKNSHSSRPSMKGRADAKELYLRHVRERIVSQRKYPYAAEKLGISALYRLKVEIGQDGGFKYEYASSDRHAAFDHAIQNLFERIGKFKAPPASAERGLVVEFDLEFKR